MRPKVERLLDYREFPVLFVDDEPENLRVFELAFRRDFQVSVAGSGEEALQMLAERPAALVLSDHRMDGMSGVELLAKVREIDPKTVRILVTAYGNFETLTDAVNNGWIYRYVAKPWRPEEMRLTMRQGIEVYALDREREELLYELEVLNRGARMFNQELELVPLLDRFLGMSTGELGYDGATVLLFDSRRELLRPVRSAPTGSEVCQRLGALDIRTAAAPRFIEKLCAGEVQLLSMQNALKLEAPIRRLMTEIAADELLVLPLVSGRGGATGALIVDNRSGGECFGVADRTLLEGLASQAVIAIDNAQLVEDLRRSREQVRRADRLGTLGTLAAGLAHEINNPLVSIQTFLSLAPEKRREDDPEFWGEYYDIARKEVLRIQGLVRTMGRLGRSGETDGPRAACDLHALCSEAVLLLAPTAAAGEVEVVLDVSDEVCKVVGIRDHLHQVVLNMLLNAIHASPIGGRVDVRVRPHEAGACLEIRDNGNGIRSEDLERIFDPFYTTKGPDQGSGLGLMICHRIVADHGGSIEVESLEGRGSTFRVLLPADRAA